MQYECNGCSTSVYFLEMQTAVSVGNVLDRERWCLPYRLYGAMLQCSRQPKNRSTYILVIQKQTILFTGFKECSYNLVL